VKAGGVVYTPPALANFLAIQAFNSLEVEQPIRILDPACGDGELLLAAVTEARCRNIEIQAVVGYDIDPAAIGVASKRLAGLQGLTLNCADFLEAAGNPAAPSQLFDVAAPSEPLVFDLVVSNPPYVRTQTLGAAVAQELGKKFGLTGRVDLYHAFAVAMIRALSVGGALGLLCSNKFLTNRAGAAMRTLLLEELCLNEIVDLGDTKLFDAAVLPVIVSGSRSERSSVITSFRSVYAAKGAVNTADPLTSSSVLGALTDGHSGVVADDGKTFIIRSGLLDREAGAGLPWNPLDEETRKCFATLRQNNVTELGSLGKIRVGVKTTADPVFIRTDWEDLPPGERPEDELIRPLLTHHDIEPWSAQVGDRRMLYPHRDDDGRAAPIDLMRYPRAAKYLAKHRERLEGRKYVIEGGRQWFEIWVPQKPALWSRPKLVFPDIAESPRFAIDRSGAIVNGDCYWMVIDDEGLADVITAVANSTFCTWFYDAACGNFLYAGRRRFMTQYMERLPIPEPTPSLVASIRKLRDRDDVAGLDKLVWSALGLEQPAR